MTLHAGLDGIKRMRGNTGDEGAQQRRYRSDLSFTAGKKKKRRQGV